MVKWFVVVVVVCFSVGFDIWWDEVMLGWICVGCMLKCLVVKGCCVFDLVDEGWCWNGDWGKWVEGNVYYWGGCMVGVWVLYVEL